MTTEQNLRSKNIRQSSNSLYRSMANTIEKVKSFTKPEPRTHPHCLFCGHSGRHMNKEIHVHINGLCQNLCFSPHRLLVVMVLLFLLSCGKSCTPCCSLVSSSFRCSIHFFAGFLLLYGCHLL